MMASARSRTLPIHRFSPGNWEGRCSREWVTKQKVGNARPGTPDAGDSGALAARLGSLQRCNVSTLNLQDIHQRSVSETAALILICRCSLLAIRRHHVTHQTTNFVQYAII
jgi:hypothetical protein